MKTAVTYILILVVLASVVDCRTRCVRVRGSVNCATNTELNRNIQVTLYDRDDLPWETDDLMGKNSTDANGAFTVEGCGYDFGLWNDPEPFIVITHGCPSETQRPYYQLLTKRKTLEMGQQFLPDEMDIGQVRLDIEEHQ